MKQIVNLFVGIILCFAVGVFAEEALAQTPKSGKIFEWKFVSHQSSGSHAGRQQIYWCKWVEQKTNGRLKLKPYWKGELCGPFDVIRVVQSGLAESGGFISNYTPGETPLCCAIYLPFVLPIRVDHSMIAIDELGKFAAIKEELDRWNCVYIGNYSSSGYEIMSNKPIRKAEDLKGVRIRAPGDIGRVFQRFGAIPVGMDITEVYTALSAGLVDAITSSGPRSQYGHKLYEISKYYIKGVGICNPSVFNVVNKHRWAELPDDIKAVFPRLMLEYAEWQWKSEWEPTEINKIYDAYRAKGVEFIEFPSEERAKLVAMAKDCWEDWIKRSGGNKAKQVLDTLITAGKNAEARYPGGVK